MFQGEGRARPAASRSLLAARLGPANRVVEIGMPRQDRHQPVQPSEHDLTTAPVADALDLQGQRSPAARSALAPGGGRGDEEGRAPASDLRTPWPAGCSRSARRSPARPVERAARRRGRSPRRRREGARANARTRSPPSGQSMSASRPRVRPDASPRAPDPSASRPRARRASSRTPVASPTSSTGPGGAIRSSRRARRPRVRRNTRRRSPRSDPMTVGTRFRMRRRARRRTAMDRSLPHRSSAHAPARSDTRSQP